MNTVERYFGALPYNWTGGEAFSKWWRGKIVHLYTLKKPCAQCGGEMRIDVTRDAIDGKAKNAGLHLKRCETCRAATRALGTSSRPKTEGEPVLPAKKHALPEEAAPATDEALRTANATMKEELEGLYAINKELRQRLSRYELGPAMEAVANGQRMPWER